jgi:hypothetical protein
MATVAVSIPNTTFLSTVQPNNNFSFYPLIFTGTDPSFGTCIGLMQIALPSLPVSFVDSAKLKLAVIVKTGANPSPVIVNTVTEPFVYNTVTYNTRPAYTATASSLNITTADLYQTVEIDITALVNQWLSGTVTNNGLALTNSDGVTLVEFATNNIVYEPYFPTLELTYSASPSESTAICFSYAQLAHVIEQLITIYPTSIFSVFTTGLVASSITGIPYELYTAPDGTYGGLFILMDSGQQEVIPLSSITAIYTGDGTVYDPTMTYLDPEDLSSGCDKNILSAISDFMASQTDVQIYLGSNISASGLIYKNEYGLVVLSDASGNTPIFIPETHITAIFPTAAAAKSRCITRPGIAIVNSYR